MRSTGLRPLVADLLQAHGLTPHSDESLEGRSGAVYEVPLLAEGGQVLLFEFKDSPDPVEEADLDYLHRLVDDAGADHAVLIHQGPAPYGLALREDVTLWGPARLRSILGDHLLHAHTGAPMRPLPLGPGADPGDVGERPFQPFPAYSAEASPATEESEVQLPELTDDGFADLLPSAFQDDPEDEDVVPMIGLDFDALESLTAPTPPAAPRPDVPEPSFGPSAIQPRIPIHEARAMVKDRITRIDTETLVLRPVHLVDYECDLMVDGTLKQDTVQGRIQVYADKKGSSRVDDEGIDVATIGTLAWNGPVEDHAFRRDAERALQDAKALVMETHTRMVDMEVDDEASDFSMMERKKVAPNGDLIRLEHKAATYRPAWRFESANGHVVIDALTGETLDESLRTRSGDTIIVD